MCHYHCILEAFGIVESITGKQMQFENVERHRAGDQICYISDLTKFKTHYPNWSITIEWIKFLQKLLNPLRRDCKFDGESLRQAMITSVSHHVYQDHWFWRRDAIFQDLHHFLPMGKLSSFRLPKITCEQALHPEAIAPPTPAPTRTAT